MLRPSLPIIRPFISSLGSCTTDIVVSATWSAAQRCIALTTNSFAFLSASSFALLSNVLTITAVSCLTSSSTVFNRYSFACSEVNPEILSSSCCLFFSSSSTFCFNLPSSSSFLVILKSRFSTASIFLSRVSSLERTRFSYFCISARLSFVSFSSSFLVLKDSSLTSKSASFFFVSAVFKASSIISLALSLALPIFSSLLLAMALPDINHVIGATTASVTRIATTIGINTGAPPY